MPSTRRKSVGFNLAEPEAQPERTRRSSRAGILQSPSVSRSTPAELGSARSTRSSGQTPKVAEADGGFKFKRRKTKKAEVATAPSVALLPEASAAPRAPAADTPAQEQTPSPATATVGAERIVSPRQESSIAAEVAAVSLSPPRPEATPSLLNAPLELLQALLLACQEMQSNGAEDGATQHMVEACLTELHRVGIKQVEPTVGNAALCEQERVLKERVGLMSATVETWDAAANEASTVLLPPSEASTPDQDALDGLPPLMDIGAQLAELYTTAALCVDQVESAARTFGRICEKSAREEKELSVAVHHTTFLGYAHMEEPRALLRSIAVA